MPPTAGRPLTRALLFERALAIVDRDGLDALTMRRLAADLGVKAPSLYNHVSGKGELLDGALRLMRAQMRLAPTTPDDWTAALGEIFSEYRRVLAAHPQMVALAGERAGAGDRSGLEYLVEQGFTADDAIELWQTLTALVVGFAMFSSGFARTDTDGLPEEFVPDAAVWRDQTCDHALQVVMESYEARRRPPLR